MRVQPILGNSNACSPILPTKNPFRPGLPIKAVSLIFRRHGKIGEWMRQPPPALISMLSIQPGPDTLRPTGKCPNGHGGQRPSPGQAPPPPPRRVPKKQNEAPQKSKFRKKGRRGKSEMRHDLMERTFQFAAWVVSLCRTLDKGSARKKLDNLGSKCAPYWVAPD